MNETTTPRSISLLVVAGAVAVLTAIALYGKESNRFGETNYGPAMVAAVIGGFLLLLAAIMSSGRRR